MSRLLSPALILLFAAKLLLQINISSAQSITQPAQIAWGRYFEDPAHPEFKWSNEDLGDKIYYFNNSIYIVGRTKSDSNAFVNCLGAAASGNGDAFVASYNLSCKTYNWVSYFGGATSTDYAYCAAIDKVGNNTWIYIAGEVNAKSKTGLPTAKSCVSSGCSSIFQTKGGDKWDGFIAKYNATTGQLVRWTYFGGKARDQILGIAVDTVTHNVYFNGYTESTSFINYSNWNFSPYKNDLSGKGDMFIGCLDSCLSQLQYFTFYGGMNSDRGHDLDILYANNTRYLVMSGTTQSSSGVVPSTNYYDNVFGGAADGSAPDAFLLIWNVANLSSAPDWGTYFGNSAADRGRGISLTSNNDIYWTGQTQCNPDNDKFLPTVDAYQPTRNGGVDCFLTKFHISSFSPVTVSLNLFTYFGGDNDDFAKSVRAFHSNNSSNGTDSVVITGLTYSANLPSQDSTSLFLSKAINGNGKETKRDAFIAVLTKDPLNPTAKEKLSSFAYLGGENDETDIKQNDVLVQKSYNPGLELGPNGSVFIVYATKGTKTKKNGNIPIEYGAFHCPDGGCVNSSTYQPDAYFAQVFPFTQHFTPPGCIEREGDEPTTNIEWIKDAIAFYPVPFFSITTLEIKSDNDVQGDVVIYDLYGKRIIEEKLVLSTGENKITLDFSAYPAGIYISRITVGEREYDEKIIKQ